MIDQGYLFKPDREESKSDSQGNEHRCDCNRLLCVIDGDTIEIKCPKCKRITRIYTRGIDRIER